MSTRWHILLLLLALFAPGTAAAQNCWVGMDNIEFGPVNYVGQPASTVNGLMSVHCNNAYTNNVRVCIALGAPVGDSWDPRYMQGSFSQLLAFNIYSDPFYTQIWGSAYSTAGTQVAVDVPIAFGSGNRNVSYYAKVPVQNNARASFYSAHFTTDDAAVRAAGYNYTPPVCTANMPIVSRFSFDVLASVWYDCTLSASPLEFGAVGVSLESAETDATSTITVTCTQDAPYSLSLDRGQGLGATVADRKLTRAGGNQRLSYQLYRDAARLRPWGDGSLGTDTVSGNGAGVNSSRSHTVYGRLARQIAPPSGVYNDTIVVTVTY